MPDCSYVTPQSCVVYKTLKGKWFDRFIWFQRLSTQHSSLPAGISINHLTFGGGIAHTTLKHHAAVQMRTSLAHGCSLQKQMIGFQLPSTIHMGLSHGLTNLSRRYVCTPHPSSLQALGKSMLLYHCICPGKGPCQLVNFQTKHWVHRSCCLVIPW